MAEAQRTLVKSPPELWAEVSDPEALTRHLGAFGEIRITRTEPETTVAWEGDRTCGTVELAAAGWGTKVTVTAEDVSAPAPEPVPRPEAAASRPGFWARLLRRRQPEPPAEPQPAPAPRIELAPPDRGDVLEEMLASLGAAHHRPFSRG